jgi:hypothetical protein
MANGASVRAQVADRPLRSIFHLPSIFASAHAAAGAARIFKKVEDFALTRTATPLCCCPAETRIPGSPGMFFSSGS